MKTRLTKRGGVVATVVGALLLSAAAIGFAQHGGHGGPGDGPHGGGGRGPRGGFMGLARDLNLSDEQKAQAQKIMAAVEESTKGLHEQLRALHQNAPGPLSGAAFDEAAVRKAAQERASLQVELEVAHARAHSQLYALLTAEQKAKLAERHQQMEGRRGEGGPHRRGGDKPEGM